MGTIYNIIEKNDGKDEIQSLSMSRKCDDCDCKDGGMKNMFPLRNLIALRSID